jgi:hypothetical protein
MTEKRVFDGVLKYHVWECQWKVHGANGDYRNVDECDLPSLEGKRVRVTIEELEGSQ